MRLDQDHHPDQWSDCNNLPGQVVLVFQGGGALGSYQAGVYQALHEADIEPDWIIGTSIGAINASLIAGNRRGDRIPKLREFWKRVETNSTWDFSGVSTSFSDALSNWSILARGIPAFFKPNALAHWGMHLPIGSDHAGYYSTTPLEKTLFELVDFGRINREGPRLTVGAAHVRSSEMRYFDSRTSDISVRHVLASGALPPAFPAIRTSAGSASCITLALAADIRHEPSTRRHQNASRPEPAGKAIGCKFDCISATALC